jgi:myo-inositol-1(or 4)-monophosphatase
MRAELERLAAILRAAARAELLPRFAAVGRHLKPDGSIVTQADLAMQERLQRMLARDFPGVALLGEEMPPAEQQRCLAAGRPFWCLDPLDGTSNFAAGVPLFAVSLALVSEGRPELAVVYDPLRDECFSAARGAGAALDGLAIVRDLAVPQTLAHAIAVVDFKRLAPGLAARLAAHPPYVSQRHFGACSLEWCWLAAGRIHLYLHGGQKLWDYAAGTLILAEAGGLASTLDGEEVFTLGLAPRSVVAAARGEAFFAAWRNWLRTPRRSR